MASRTVRLAAAFLLPLLLLVLACQGAGNLASVSALGPRFDAQAGQVRLVALLSPT